MLKMSTFYSTSTNQRSTTPNLCLSDPGHSSYTESSIPSNMLYLNDSSSVLYSDALSGNTQPQQDCLDLPVATNIISQGLSLGITNIVPSHLHQHTYHSLKDGRNEMLFMQSVGGSMSDAADILRLDDQQMSLRSQLGILNGQNLSLQQSGVSSMQNQGLSLSLSTQIPVPSFQYRPGLMEISFASPHQSTSGNSGSLREEAYRDKNTCGNISPHGLSTLASSIPNSKYLKAAHELLDEVVNVRRALKQKPDKSQSHTSAGTSTCRDTDVGSKGEGLPANPVDSTANSSNELSPSERQDLQNKVTKLLAMLDEVDRRYKQYYHQMQIVVSSFDAIVGCGAAKPYTALALQTISRHFRCLRDAISDQIRVTRKTLGEQDSSSGKSGGLSRLRYIDQQLRQQRTLQQFGMMQQHAWRPQRGLPESSVSILRAWLFEHFLHPYPKDSEKLVLARQTGLTRSQVSNWFINARVRLWKPMIEDMYKEETGEAEIDSNSSSDNLTTVKEDGQSSKDLEDLQSPGTERCQTSQFTGSSQLKVVNGADISGSSSGFQSDGIADAYMNLKVIEQRPIGEDSGFLQEAITQPDGSGRFMAYQMSELGCYAGGGVSLTLRLQHFNGGASVPDDQQNFLRVRENEIYGAAAPTGTDTADYDYMSMGDQRHRFSSSHLLHDFVA